MASPISRALSAALTLWPAYSRFAVTPERIERLRQVLDRRQPDLTVVTDFVHKQRNLSAIVRMCDAVGIMDIHAVLCEEDYQAFRGIARGRTTGLKCLTTVHWTGH
jgi:tRNA G18 (ribose-2'-O)-methylase SpoU